MNTILLKIIGISVNIVFFFLIALFIAMVIQYCLRIFTSNNFTKEKFAFYSLLLIIFISLIVVFIILDIEMLNKILGANNIKSIANIRNATLEEKILSIFILYLFMSFQIEIYKNWKGRVSKRQYKQSKNNEQTTLIEDVKALFGKDKENLKVSIPGEIERAKGLLKKNQLKDAINILDELGKKEGNMNNDVIFIHSRLNELNDSKIKGMISLDEFIINKNKIIESILLAIEKY